MAKTIKQTHKLIDGTIDDGKARVVLELRLDITQYPEQNKSDINAEVWFLTDIYNEKNRMYDFEFSFNTSDGDIFPFRYIRNNVTYKYGEFEQSNPTILTNTTNYTSRTPLASPNDKYYSVSTSISNVLWFKQRYFSTNFSINHNLDGTLQLKFTNNVDEITDKNNSHTTYTTRVGNLIIDIPAIDRGAGMLITANDFTDEENPSFTYKANSGRSQTFWLFKDDLYHSQKADTVKSLQVALSIDGYEDDVPYRNIPIDGSNYTFELTEAERETLRQKAQGENPVDVYYLIKAEIEVLNRSFSEDYYDSEYYETIVVEDWVARNLTIVGCDPILNPTVKDIREETLALTGDENTFVKYESTAEFDVNATASKGATIITETVQCGSKTIKGLSYGIIDDVESGTFIFHVTDSRNMGASSSVFKNFVEYLKPTCYQKEEIEVIGETEAAITIILNGSYYNGSFGAVDNTLTLEVRHTDGDSNAFGDWKVITDTPTFNGNTYKLETTLTGFDYSKVYIFQCRAIDKLNEVRSSSYTISMKPVFDWGETDFNFNVPIKMNEQTVLRHNKEANNTVLSASGGHIYIRPKGSEDTAGEIIVYPDGSVKLGNTTFEGNTTFNGDATLNGSLTIGKELLNDFVIEIGSESMGSNGTWYWRKWNSGKAECWGCRNFGNMAVTTAWGNLYRSAIFTQDLPEDLFARTPDSIGINIVHGGYGGWICKHEQTAPSAITTGSFIYVRPASATVTPSNIGFHIIGEWY